MGHDCRTVGVCREKAALCHKGRGRLKSCFSDGLCEPCAI
ncbi:hypothetical protein HMPREF9123_1666 [Neisseria bacilliformis ATCC BAA-1200]|uniref:Uncharacterized protein n=1 Tax=Neisseria bacilliformis ATCC BAA-1200 TaxID=888742 RepID=F2BD64_9NEIS|nr:hypothetical protein HMPREF9123_1666 [Neisseria bacilliformis ATCC BAA-1200]